MIHRKHIHPFREIKFHCCQRKFIQDFFQKAINIFLFQLLAVHRHHGHIVFLPDFLRYLSGLLGIRFLAVHQHKEGFSGLFQRQDCLLFRSQIIASGKFPDTAVRSDHKTDGGMIPHDFIRADLCRLGKRNLFLRPGSLHHALRIFFHVSRRTVDHISHTVDQPYRYFNIIIQSHLCRFVGNKLWLRSGNGLTSRALRQFILCPHSGMFILHIGQHHFIHKALDKCRLSGPHRSQYPYVDFPSRPLLYIPIQIVCIHCIVHKNTSCHWCYMYMQAVCNYELTGKLVKRPRSPHWG